jgi:stage II sporulation protein D
LLPILAMPLVGLPMAGLPPLSPAGPGAIGAVRLQPAPSGGPELRVLLRQEGLLNLASLEGTVRVADAGGRTLLELRPGDRLSLRPGPDGSGFEATLQMAAQPTAVSQVLPLAELWLTPRREGGSEALTVLQERAYRGRLQLTSREGGLRAINHVALETYLASVVGSEMPASWPLNALSAQAVAARTYALAQRRPAAPFDLKATVASQVYGGVATETPSTRAAVERTRGQVLMHGGSLINAVFHSSSGGSTENSGEMWSRQLPYLVSVPDYDQTSPVFRWETSFDPLQLRRAFRETDGVQSIEVLETSSTGRIRRARILGPAGSLEISGTELRQRLGLRSTLASFRLQPLPASAAPDATPAARPRLAPPPLPEGEWADPASGAPMAAVPSGGESTSPVASATAAAAAARPASLPVLLVSGRGFGHGVGMSQWGALAMAQQGRDYRQILSHYYRGAELRSLPSP